MTDDDIVLGAFLDFLNAVEAGIASAKQQIARAKHVPSPQDTAAVAAIRRAFPDKLATLLNFKPSAKGVTITPTRFLGSDNFARIAAIIRNLGGEYVSAGKQSHFHTPLPAEPTHAAQ